MISDSAAKTFAATDFAQKQSCRFLSVGDVGSILSLVLTSEVTVALLG
jgi:hypothetical protein